MARRKRTGFKGRKWLNTQLPENVSSLTTTVTALELKACSSPTTSDGFDIANDNNSSGEDLIAEAKMSTPSSTSTNVTETDEESELEEADVDVYTTVVQQVQMHLGIYNSAGNDDDQNNQNNNFNNESNVTISPVDYATLDVLKLCHNAGCSLEFYDILFALL